MSNVYSRSCELDEATPAGNDGDGSDPINESVDSPACLANVTPKRQYGKRLPKPPNVLNVESELEISNGKIHRKQNKSSQVKSSATTTTTNETSIQKRNQVINESAGKINSWKNNNKKIEEYELADDAISFDGDEIQTSSTTKKHVGVLLSDSNAKQMIRVHGIEELPAQQMNSTTKHTFENDKRDGKKSNFLGCAKSKTTNLSKSTFSKKENIEWLGQRVLPQQKSTHSDNDCNGNCSGRRVYSTLPKMKRNGQQQQQQRHDNNHERQMQIPMRTTPDGTTIYYWCELSKKRLKGYIQIYINIPIHFINFDVYLHVQYHRFFKLHFHTYKSNKYLIYI